MAKIKIEIRDLERLLRQHEKRVIEYITGNIGSTDFIQEIRGMKIENYPDKEKEFKESMIRIGSNLDLPNDVLTLKKYIDGTD